MKIICEERIIGVPGRDNVGIVLSNSRLSLYVSPDRGA